MKGRERKVTETGGRNATTRHIPPKLALAVGMPSTPAPRGWQWSALTDLARLESGHTPSRKHPEYWGGEIPWIGISDARAHDGRRIEDTQEKTNELGIKYSSARVLPQNTVCLSRTASVGYVVVMGRPMATSQDFVNWVCSKQLDHNFLKYLFIAEDENLLRFASGSVHQTIYFPEVKAFHICHPPLAEQQRIVGLLDEAFADLATAQARAEKNLQNARALFESHLQTVFTQRGKGWMKKTLEEVLTVQPQNGWSPPAANHADSGTPVLTLSSVTGFVFRPDKLKYTSANTDPKARYWIQNGDFLITRSNTPELVGHVAIAAGIERPTIYPDLIMRMRPDPAKALTEFLYYQMRTPALREEIAGRAQGANPTMKKISNGAVRTLPISVPPLDQQRAIAAQLDALSAETQRLAAIYTRKLAALAALKQSLLHQAFAGEL